MTHIILTSLQVKGKLFDSADIIVLAVKALGELARLRLLQNALARNGAIWVGVAPRGAKHIPEREILACGPLPPG